MILLQYIRERDVDAYTVQGWRCTLLAGHHARYRRFMAEMRL